MIRLALVLVVATLLASCSPSPTAPSASASVSGVWSGSLSRAAGGSGQLRLFLQEPPATSVFIISGSYEIRLTEGTVSGTLLGSGDSGSLLLFLRPTQQALACSASRSPEAGHVTLQLRVDGRRLDGDAELTMCGGLERARVSLSR